MTGPAPPRSRRRVPTRGRTRRTARTREPRGRTTPIPRGDVRPRPCARPSPDAVRPARRPVAHPSDSGRPGPPPHGTRRAASGPVHPDTPVPARGGDSSPAGFTVTVPTPCPRGEVTPTASLRATGRGGTSRGLRPRQRLAPRSRIARSPDCAAPNRGLAPGAPCPTAHDPGHLPGLTRIRAPAGPARTRLRDPPGPGHAPDTNRACCLDSKGRCPGSGTVPGSRIRGSSP